MNNNSVIKKSINSHASPQRQRAAKTTFFKSSFKNILLKKSSQPVNSKHNHQIKSNQDHIIHDEKKTQDHKQEHLMCHDMIQPHSTIFMQFNHERHLQSHLHIFAHGKSFFQNDDDISRIFKKIVLNFNAEQGDSQFEINKGLFKGIRFTIKTRGRNLSLNVFNADKYAQSLILQNKNLLKNRLLSREIQLQELRFRY